MEFGADTPSYLEAPLQKHSSKNHSKSSTYTMEDWFKVLDDNLMSATKKGYGRSLDKEQNNEEMLDVCREIVSTKARRWKSLMLDQISHPQKNSRRRRWVEEIYNSFQRERKHDQVRSRLCRTPQMLKRIFIVIVSDTRKDLTRAKREYYHITGNAAEEEKLSEDLRDVINTQKDALEKFAHRPEPYDAPWTSTKLTTHPIPKGVMALLYNSDSNSETVQDMVRMMNSGARTEEFQGELDMQSALHASRYPSNDFFPQYYMSRPWGPKELDHGLKNSDLVKMCQVFTPVQNVLYGLKRVPCEIKDYETKDDDDDEENVDHNVDSDDDNIRVQSRLNESAFLPEVSPCDLTGRQQDLIWNCSIPLWFGSMYWAFSAPSDTAKKAMIEHWHSSFILSSHGISSDGRSFIETVVPLFSLLVNHHSAKDSGSGLQMHFKIQDDQIRICRLGYIELESSSRSIQIAIDLKEQGPDGDAHEVLREVATSKSLAKHFMYSDNILDTGGTFDVRCTSVAQESEDYMVVSDSCSTNEAMHKVIIPPFFLTEVKEKHATYALTWHPEYKKGVPCHLKRVLDCYRSHCINTQKMYSDLAPHNMLLHRHEALHSEPSYRKIKHSPYESMFNRR